MMSNPSVLDRLDRAWAADLRSVPAFVYGDPAVFEAEQRAIFARDWQYVAHLSELAHPGDFVLRPLGSRTVIVARGDDGVLRAFLNLCRHHGMRVCREDGGRAAAFRCPYHGFTYRNTGELIGVPYEHKAYGETMDKGRLGLYTVRTAVYRDLVFATLASDPLPLDEYLGDMRWYLDLVVGRAPMEVVGPAQRWEVATNWKIPAENFMTDAYHTMFSHRSISEIGMAPRADFAHSGYQVYAGRGHGLGLGAPAEVFMFAPELKPVFARQLSPAQFGVLEQMKNCHGTVFPNFSFLISLLRFKEAPVSFTTLRVWQPLAVGRIRVWSWLLMEREAPPAWKERSYQAYLLTFGPSGIFEQDDTENWTDVFENVGAADTEELGIRFQYDMGWERPPLTDFPGPGTVYPGKYTEANGRGFFEWWRRRLAEAQRG
jgi:phenylpropionate dioxygenase-like ring-hydroxylating dioxygenase large terminal subunit